MAKVSRRKPGWRNGAASRFQSERPGVMPGRQRFKDSEMNDDVRHATRSGDREGAGESEQEMTGRVQPVQQRAVEEAREDKKSAENALANAPKAARALGRKQIGHPTVPWGGAALPQHIAQAERDR